MTYHRLCPRRVRSHLGLDFLEDRLLLSILVGCPSSVVAAPTTAAVQGASQSTCTQTDAVQTAASADNTGGTICPVTGATIASADAVLNPVNTVQAADPPQPAMANSVTAVAAAPAILPQLPLVNPALLGGDELSRVEPPGPELTQAEPESNYFTANFSFVSSDEYDMSRVDNEATSDRDRTMPTALLAQADESNLRSSSLEATYHLVPDFQPLDSSSPFLLATLRSVEGQAPNSWVKSAVRASDDSAVEKTAEQTFDIEAAPADINEGTPIDSRPLATAPAPTAQLDRENSAADSSEQEGYSLEFTWLQTAQMAVPIAGFILALGFCRAQSWSGWSGSDPIRKIVKRAELLR